MISPPLPTLLLADGEPGRLVTTPLPSRSGLLNSPGVKCRWVSFHNPLKSTYSREVKP